jgi:hypothetical protein
MLTQLLLEAKGLPPISDAAAQHHQEKRLNFQFLKIMVGRQAFNMIPELWEITGGDGYAPDALMALKTG